MKRNSKPYSSMNASFVVCLLLGGVMIFTVIAICLFSALPSSERQDFFGSIQSGVPERHLIPDGYRGWIIVEHNVNGEATLPVEDGVNIFRYSEAGELHTSSRWKPGLKDKAFLFETELGPVKISQSGPARQIWGDMDVTMREKKDGPIVARRSCYFVGTKEEYKQAGNYFEGHALKTVMDRLDTNQSYETKTSNTN